MITALAAATAALVGCASGRTTPLTASPEVPAAEGRVETRRDAPNTEIEVEVEHLAPPGKVAEGATTYVVWTKAGEGKAQNVGALVVDKDRTGSLKTKTPHESFELIVTPEAVPNASEPTNKPVLRAKVPK